MQKTIIEDNVQVPKTCGTAESADAFAEKDFRSALPPKFKDVNALAEAYNALQAEFTRRCQRLKELEMRARKFSETDRKQPDNKPKSDADGGVHAAEGADKTLHYPTENGVGTVSDSDKETSGAANADMTFEDKDKENREAAKALDKGGENAAFKAAAAADEKQADERNADLKKTVSGNCAAGETAGNTPENTAENTSGNFGAGGNAAEMKIDEETRLKIIGEYLSSLRKNDAPLLRGGAGTFGTPPVRATSLEEAGAMALRAFKRN